MYLIIPCLYTFLYFIHQYVFYTCFYSFFFFFFFFLGKLATHYLLATPTLEFISQVQSSAYICMCVYCHALLMVNEKITRLICRSSCMQLVIIQCHHQGQCIKCLMVISASSTLCWLSFGEWNLLSQSVIVANLKGWLEATGFATVDCSPWHLEWHHSQSIHQSIGVSTSMFNSTDSRWLPDYLLMISELHLDVAWVTVGLRTNLIILAMNQAQAFMLYNMFVAGFHCFACKLRTCANGFALVLYINSIHFSILNLSHCTNLFLLKLIVAAANKLTMINFIMHTHIGLLYKYPNATVFAATPTFPCSTIYEEVQLSAVDSFCLKAPQVL